MDTPRQKGGKAESAEDGDGVGGADEDEGVVGGDDGVGRGEEGFHAAAGVQALDQEDVEAQGAREGGIAEGLATKYSIINISLIVFIIYPLVLSIQAIGL